MNIRARRATQSLNLIMFDASVQTKAQLLRDVGAVGVPDPVSVEAVKVIDRQA